MTGISEILVLILLISGILILPRMFKPAPKAKKKKAKPISLTIKLRAGIVISLLFPLLTALMIKPWQGELIIYISIGILPVLMVWAVIWILSAKRN